MQSNTGLCVELAVHQAKAELRSKDIADKQRHRTTFCDIIEGADYPNLVLAETVRRLGRHKALAVEIDKGVVRAAFKVK